MRWYRLMSTFLGLVSIAELFWCWCGRITAVPPNCLLTDDWLTDWDLSGDKLFDWLLTDDKQSLSDWLLAERLSLFTWHLCSLLGWTCFSGQGLHANDRNVLSIYGFQGAIAGVISWDFAGAFSGAFFVWDRVVTWLEWSDKGWIYGRLPMNWTEKIRLLLGVKTLISSPWPDRRCFFLNHIFQETMKHQVPVENEGIQECSIGQWLV